MRARYIIRLDDACPTMDRNKWGTVEHILDNYSVRPVVAVIPDNKDPSLIRDEPDSNFWDMVRKWSDKGWEIAMHGETHQMHETELPSIFPFYNRSEFTGLPLDQQIIKLKRAKEIFDRERIPVRTWIAPAHCFDRTTLKALRIATGIRIISDGIAAQQYHESGFYWIPQQFSRFKKMPFGLWTICFHPNEMTEQDLIEFENNISRYSQSIVSVSDLDLTLRPRRMIDHILNAYFWLKRRKLHAAFH